MNESPPPTADDYIERRPRFALLPGLWVICLLLMLAGFGILMIFGLVYSMRYSPDWPKIVSLGIIYFKGHPIVSSLATFFLYCIATDGDSGMSLVYCAGPGVGLVAMGCGLWLRRPWARRMTVDLATALLMATWFPALLYLALFRGRVGWIGTKIGGLLVLMSFLCLWILWYLHRVQVSAAFAPPAKPRSIPADEQKNVSVRGVPQRLGLQAEPDSVSLAITPRCRICGGALSTGSQEVCAICVTDRDILSREMHRE